MEEKQQGIEIDEELRPRVVMLSQVLELAPIPYQDHVKAKQALGSLVAELQELRKRGESKDEKTNA